MMSGELCEVDVRALCVERTGSAENATGKRGSTVETLSCEKMSRKPLLSALRVTDTRMLKEQGEKPGPCRSPLFLS